MRLGLSLDALKEKSLGYWATALVVLVVSIYLSEFSYKFPYVNKFRSSLFQTIMEIDRRPTVPRSVKVVTIDDSEYWKGYPAGRRPIKRDYLGRILKRLDEANASLIALDFDVRLPDPTLGSSIPPEYEAETLTLIRTIKDVSSRRPVVGIETIGEDSLGYHREADIFEHYGLCTSMDGNGNWQHSGSKEGGISASDKFALSCGFIALPKDLNEVPVQITLGDASKLDSFSLAIARFVNPSLSQYISQRNQVEYGSYIAPNEFVRFDAVTPTSEFFLLSNQDLQRRFSGKPVIVGAEWSTLAFHRGSLIDMHQTPIGNMPGVLMHANFVEALLDSRIFNDLPDWAAIVFEGGAGFFALLIFSATEHRYHFIWALALTLGFFVAQWLAIHELGLFVDSILVVVALWLHSAIDRLLVWLSAKMKVYRQKLKGDSDAIVEEDS